MAMQSQWKALLRLYPGRGTRSLVQSGLMLLKQCGRRTKEVVSTGQMQNNEHTL